MTLTKYCCLIIIIIAVGCNNESKEWNKTKNSGSEIVINNFINKYPRSVYLKEAYKQIFKIQKTKNLKKYFLILNNDTITGNYDVSILIDTISVNKRKYIRNDFLLTQHISWGLYVTKSSRFNHIDSLSPGKTYTSIGICVIPKSISDESINRRALNINNTIDSMIMNMKKEDKTYINVDTLENLYAMYNQVSPEFFDSLKKIKLLDDEYEMLLQNYRMVHEMPDSFKNKPVNFIIVDELIKAEN